MEIITKVSDSELSDYLSLIRLMTGEETTMAVELGKEFKVLPFMAIRVDKPENGCAITIKIHEDYTKDMFSFVERHLDAYKKIIGGTIGFFKAAVKKFPSLVDDAAEIGKKWNRRALEEEKAEKETTEEFIA